MIIKHVSLDFNWGLLENNYSYVEILFEIAFIFFIKWFLTVFRKHVTISKLCSQINSPRIWKVDNVTHIARCTAIIYRKQFVVHISVYATSYYYRYYHYRWWCEITLFFCAQDSVQQSKNLVYFYVLANNKNNTLLNCDWVNVPKRPYMFMIVYVKCGT